MRASLGPVPPTPKDSPGLAVYGYWEERPGGGSPRKRDFMPAARAGEQRRALARRARALSGALGVLMLCASGCGRRPNASGDAPAAWGGTPQMAALLARIARTTQPADIPFYLNAGRARILRAEMERAPTLEAKAPLWLQHAIELLNAGETRGAQESLAELERTLRSREPFLWEQMGLEVATWRAVASLREGEEANCCAVNTAESCLLPITGGGVHRRQEGSRRAMAILQRILRKHPGDLRARWLLSIAAMTLGRYPDGVPARWRIPPAAFASEHPFLRFPNVAPRLGLAIRGLSGGCVADDLNGDGLLDLMVSSMGLPDQLRLFLNRGDGRFQEWTQQAGLAGETGGLNLMPADYDNDGDLDVMVLRGGWMGKAGRFPCSLLRNEGGARFVDVTGSAGLLRAGPTQAAAWLDYDLDGLLDLFLAFESGPHGAHPCALYRNLGNGAFADVAHRAGVALTGYVKAAVAADYDNDGDPDLFLSRLEEGGARNVLYRNDGNGTFVDVAEAAGIRGPRFSFPAAFFDYDNDGWTDLFVCGFNVSTLAEVAADYLGRPQGGERPRLYRNNRDGTFTDVTRQAGLDRLILGMGINVGDLDNDGWLDLYVGTGNPSLDMVIPNRMFRNDGGRRFQEVTTAGGFGHLQKGHGIAFADLNNDGQQDVFAQMGGANFSDVAYSALFANPGHRGRWLVLRLEGARTNRGAMGARIRVTARTPRGRRTLHRTVGTGGSFGANPLRAEIGLGSADAVERVEVYWPVTRRLEQFTGLWPDRRYHLREGTGRAVEEHVPSFRWPSP